MRPAPDAPLVVSCSALKRSYRDLLRESAGKPVAFVYLHGDRDVLTGRMQRRTGHFMPASLLASQFETLEALESDERGTTIDVDQSIDSIVDTYMSKASKTASTSARTTQQEIR